MITYNPLEKMFLANATAPNVHLANPERQKAILEVLVKLEANGKADSLEGISLMAAIIFVDSIHHQSETDLRSLKVGYKSLAERASNLHIERGAVLNAEVAVDKELGIVSLEKARGLLTQSIVKVAAGKCELGQKDFIDACSIFKALING